MFRIHMLPAGRGDSFLVEYGSPGAVHRVLIDGGVHRTHSLIRSKIERSSDRRLDLLVVTHVDVDHIMGVLELLSNPIPGLELDEIWFNGWKQIEPYEDRLLGSRQGERLSEHLLRGGYPWNRSFEGHAVMVNRDREDLPVVTLAGGLKLTLLSPPRERLQALARVWRREIEKAGLILGSVDETLEATDDDDRRDLLLGSEPLPDIQSMARTPFEPDRSIANGSSIAFLAEYSGKRCLFTGDAFAVDIEAGIRKIAAAEGERVLAMDAMKVSHHGGRKSTSLELLDALACRRFLFSSDGTIYQHPDLEAISRIIVGGRRLGAPQLFFNYRSAWTKLFDDFRLYRAPGQAYEPVFPSVGEAGLVLDL